MKDFKEIVSQFQIDEALCEVRPLGNGNINETYEVICGQDHYVLQEINRYVFRHPVDVMNNLFLVTEHLQKKIAQEGGDPARETLNFIRTRDGYPLLQTGGNGFYRMYRMIQGAEAMDQMHSLSCAEHAAGAYGKFQKRLADFDSSRLSETLVRFHDTKYQMQLLLDAIRADMCARSSGCGKEIRFVLERSERLGIITDEMKSGQIPQRVTHNDTKNSNVLMDKETREAVCVIDLDTVMSGSALYDYGDMVRSGACPADVGDAENTKLDFELFEACTRGYLAQMRDDLCLREKELMVYSAWLMTMELGIRYLADYLNGDFYFRRGAGTDANYKKAVQQFALAADMEEKEGQMREIVRRYL